MTIGPEPMTRTWLEVGAAWHQRAPRRPSGRRTGRTGSRRRAGRPRPPGGTAPRRPGTSTQRRPSTTSSLGQMWLTSTRPNVGVDGSPSQRRVDGEAVVLRGDLDLAGGVVHHRLVDAAVAEAQLVGAEAQRPAEDLVAEADAEQRDPGAEHLAGQRHRVGRRWPGRRGRWRGTPRRRRPPAISSKVAVAGSTCISMPRSAMRCGVIGLDAEVQRGDGEPLARPSAGTT